MEPKSEKSKPPPIKPKPKLPPNYITKNLPVTTVADESPKANHKLLDVPENDSCRDSCNSSLSSYPPSANDSNNEKSQSVLTRSTHQKPPSTVSSVNLNAKDNQSKNSLLEQQTQNYTDRPVIKALRPPPRAKRQSIKPNPSVCSNEKLDNDNQVNINDGIQEETKVVLRQKSTSRENMADRRSSRPVRGTLMTAFEDLLSKTGGIDQPKILRRRTPQWNAQSRPLARVSGRSRNDSTDSEASSAGSDASGTSGTINISESPPSHPLSKGGSETREMSVSPVPQPDPPSHSPSEGVAEARVMSVSPVPKPDPPGHILSKGGTNIRGSSMYPVPKAVDNHVDDEPVRFSLITTTLLAETTAIVAAVTPVTGTVSMAPEAKPNAHVTHDNQSESLTDTNTETLNESAKNQSADEANMENVYGEVWSHDSSSTEKTTPGTSVSALIPITRKGSSPLPFQASTSPHLDTRRPSEPPPAPPSLVTGSPSFKKKLSPGRPPPPVPGNSPSKSGPPARPPPPVRPAAAGVNVQSQHQRELPKIPSGASLDEQIYADIDTDSMQDPDDYVDPESVDNLTTPPNNGLSHSGQSRPQTPIAPSTIDTDADVTNGNENNQGDTGEEEYMVPVNEWPEDVAPVPDVNSPLHSTSHAPNHTHNKSATLQSVTSNIYEDLMDSSSDEGKQGTGSSNARPDIFSDYLDETFENEDLEKESSSDSEVEVEESEEEKMEKKKAKVFNVAKEIMTSEEDFLDKLMLLNIDFRKHVSDKTGESGEHIIPPQSMNKILNYLPQLSEINADLLKDVKLRIENWEEDPRIADIFVKKGPFLAMYTTYIRNFQNMTSELDQAFKEFPMFADALQEFERSPRCRNLQLRHYMLKPIQRIPQYRMLLSQYQKYLLEDSPDIADTQTALDIVSRVADHANEAMKQNDSLQSMIELQNVLVGDFKVIEPSRVLVRKGDMYKQSRKELQPRTLFLFNDYLVITTPQPGGYYKIRHSLPLLNMRVNKSEQEDFQKEFTIITKRKSFRSVAFTPRERDEWAAILQKTIDERERKLGTYHRGLESASSREYVLGEVAPVWIPDDRVSMCMVCSNSFTMLNRRHHCRACGKVVCGQCSAYKAPLKYEEYKQRRVCGVCFDKLYDEADNNPPEEDPPPSSENSSTNGQVKMRGPSRKLFVKTSRETVKTPQRKGLPSVLQEVHADANEQGVCSGYLNMQKQKRWKKFWFVLKDKVLYKYNASEDTAAIESKPLLGYKVAQVGSSCEGFDKTVMFRLFHPAIDIIEPMIFKTETAAAAEKWISMMQESTTA